MLLLTKMTKKNKEILSYIIVPACWGLLVLMDIIGRNITLITYFEYAIFLATSLWSITRLTRINAS